MGDSRHGEKDMSIEIAGIHFSLRCPHPIDFSRLAPAYRTFTEQTGRSTCDMSVTVMLETGPMPETTGMIKVFDTERSWSLFRQDDAYFLGLNSPALSNHFIWLARFDHTLETITIYCGELFLSGKNGSTMVSSPLSYPLDQLLLMYILAKREGALIHAAGLDLRGKGFIFPGKSGAGKSTLSGLFLGRQGTGMLSDDRVVVRNIKGAFNVFGTPWAGDAGIAENRGLPLSGIFFIRHADNNMIRAIKPDQVIERLLPLISVPWYDRDLIPEVLSCCDSLASSVPGYELSFRPDGEVAHYFETFISGLSP